MNTETGEDGTEYFFEGNGEPQGPVTLDALLGHVTPETLVWRYGLDDWIPASELPEFRTRGDTRAGSRRDHRPSKTKADRAPATASSGESVTVSSGHHSGPPKPNGPEPPDGPSDLSASGSDRTELPVEERSGSGPPRVVWTAIISLLLVGSLWTSVRNLSDREQAAESDPSSFQSPRNEYVIDPPAGHPLRAEILDAVRPHLELVLGMDVLFMVSHLRLYDRWAFFQGTPVDTNGQPLSEPDLHRIFEDEWLLMDGIRTEAILERIGDAWTVREMGIGATEIWWQHHCDESNLRPVLFACPS